MTMLPFTHGEVEEIQSLLNDWGMDVVIFCTLTETMVVRNQSEVYLVNLKTWAKVLFNYANSGIAPPMPPELIPEVSDYILR